MSVRNHAPGTKLSLVIKFLSREVSETFCRYTGTGVELKLSS